MHLPTSTLPDTTLHVALFEDRYGAGAYDRLLLLLDEPCVSFAEIATRYGVTRERVRQWHLQLRPGAPRGHARQRLCLRKKQRRELLADPLFRSFYRAARTHFSPQQIAPVPSRTGFRLRLVRLDGHLVAIRSARASKKLRADGSVVYELSPRARGVDFIFYRLRDTSFLFLPIDRAPKRAATFADNADSKYWPFRNRFHVIRGIISAMARSGASVIVERRGILSSSPGSSPRN